MAKKKINPVTRKAGAKQNRINWTTIKELYIIREDLPSAEDLGKEFGIARNQITRRCTKEKWVAARKAYWEKVLSKSVQNAQDEAAVRLAQNKNLIGGAISYIVECIRKKKIKATLGDLDKLIRLREFIEGAPDSRHEEKCDDFLLALSALKSKSFMTRSGQLRREIYENATGNNMVLATLAEAEQKFAIPEFPSIDSESSGTSKE